MHVRAACKLLKWFPRYNQSIFMNVVTCDESLLTKKCKKALYCRKDHKDYQCEKGYTCHIFHY